MAKRLKRRRDPVQLAKLIGDIATGQLRTAVEIGLGLGSLFLSTNIPSSRSSSN